MKHVCRERLIETHAHTHIAAAAAAAPITFPVCETCKYSNGAVLQPLHWQYADD